LTLARPEKVSLPSELAKWWLRHICVSFCNRGGFEVSSDLVKYLTSDDSLSSSNGVAQFKTADSPNSEWGEPIPVRPAGKQLY
jgi:hypothetical protein